MIRRRLLPLRSLARTALGLGLLAAPLEAAPRPVTVDDLMRVRSIAEVRIAPDGSRVAYVVSQPSFEKDEHEAVLYLVAAAGGEAVRLTHGTRIFNKPRPHPRLRWSPDGTRLSFLAFAGDLPQVHVLDVRGGEARAVTTSPQASRTTSGRPTAPGSPTSLRTRPPPRRSAGARTSRSLSRWTSRTARRGSGCRRSAAAPLAR